MSAARAAKPDPIHAPKSEPDTRSRRPIRQPQQARSRRTREAVLEAAGRCFEECGYDETTTAMIAERAGIAVGTLYGYFQDKRDILLEILDRNKITTLMVTHSVRAAGLADTVFELGQPSSISQSDHEPSPLD